MWFTTGVVCEAAAMRLLYHGRITFFCDVWTFFFRTSPIRERPKSLPQRTQSDTEERHRGIPQANILRVLIATFLRGFPRWNSVSSVVKVFRFARNKQAVLEIFEQFRSWVFGI